MAGFVSSPPSSAPAPTPDDLVAGDAFWPDVSLATFRDSARIVTQVTDARARDALRGGMLSVRRELSAWQLMAVLAGADRLADVHDAEVDGEAALVILYRRAVFAYAAADLAETHGEISATGEGRDRAEEIAVSADDHRRNATHAIRDILGTTRTAVELI